MDRASPPAPQSSIEPSSRRLALALSVAILAISFAALFFRKAAPTHPLVAAGIRLTIAAVILLPKVLWTSRTQQLSRRFWLTAIAAGMLYSVHFGAWVTSLTMTTVAASVTLVTATPILLALHGVLTGRDRPNRGLWVAIALAVVGVATIGAHDLQASTGALAGDGLAFLGAAAMAGYMILARSLGTGLDTFAFSGVATATGAVVLLGTAAVGGIPIEPASASAAGYLLMSALVPQLIGHSLLTWCLRHTRPAVVGMSTVGEPVGATILSFLWLGEPVAPLVAAGCTVTLAAVVIALRKREPQHHPDDQPRT